MAEQVVLSEKDLQLIYMNSTTIQAAWTNKQIDAVTPRPGSIAAFFEIPLERPRIWDMLLSQSVLELKPYIVDALCDSRVMRDAPSHGAIWKAAGE